MGWDQDNPHFFAGCLALQNYKLSVTDSVTVQEGLCVFVPCQVQYPTSHGSVFGFWFRAGADINLDPPVATNDPHRSVQKETQGRFYLMGNQNTDNCSLDIRDARKTDTGKYFFRLDGSVKFSFRNPMLSVQVIGKWRGDMWRSLF